MGEIEIQAVEIEEGTVPVISFGEGTKPFVILPGLSLFQLAPSAEAIQARYACLAKDFRVYAIDRREQADERITMGDLANDAAQTLKSLGIENACVSGVSQGGMMAMLLAIEHPELVNCLMLCSTAASVGPEAASRIQTWSDLAAAGDMPQLASEFGQAVYSPAFYAGAADALSDACEHASDDDRRRFIACAKALIGFDIVGQLTSIKAPAAVFGGTGDMTISYADIVSLADALNASLKTYEGAPHACYDEETGYPEDLYEFAREFL